MPRIHELLAAGEVFKIKKVDATNARIKTGWFRWLAIVFADALSSIIPKYKGVIL